MARHRLERIEQRHEDDRPDLLVVLDHYGADTNHARSKQVISCVFHDDTNPSCSVDSDKQLFNCKSCGVAGDVYVLIQQKEATDFRGAVAFGAALTSTTGNAGTSGKPVRNGSNARSRPLVAGQGDQPGNRPWAPTWRGRRTGART